MPASQEQKVDFLLKKIGYSVSKTGIAEDETTISGSPTNTPKKPFEEGIPSPLIVPQSSLWADSGYIPTTPPGSDTAYVKGYRTATALRMTRDTTVGTNTRSYIAYTTYNNTSSARLTNWIDTQFGSSYIIKVYKGDPNSSGVELPQVGANNQRDSWFFDYSSGVLNFNGELLPSGINATNIYIVGYRYIGATGARPPAGIGTFEHLYVAGVSTFMGSVDANSNLDVAGISTFQGLIDANGLIEATAGQNKIPSLYNAFSDLPNAGTYHGMFAHVHEHHRGYFAHAGGWYELVNKESDGRVGTGTETYNVGFLDATNLDVTGITTLGSIGISTGRITGPSITYIDPATVGDDTGTLVVKGNLQVEGTQTVVNSSTMTVTDKNIELAKGAANDAAADGGGITIDSGGGDKTWQWLDATDSWTSSEHIRIPDDKVFGFASDTNTFISRPAADAIAFTNGGTERVRITTTGVGIHTDNTTYNSSTYQFVVKTNNINAGITLHSLSSGQGAVLFTDTGGGSAQGQIRYDHVNNQMNFFANSQQRMSIGHNGAVGIGTTRAESLDNTAHDLVIGKGQTGIDAGLTIFTGTDAEGKIFFADSLASASDKKRGQIIYDHTDNSMQFATNAAEAVRITSTGSVGIGTTNPSNKLHIQSSDDTLALFESTDGLAQIQFKDNSSNANLPTIGIQGNSFYFDNMGSTSLRIAPGKVGVNEAAPLCDFHVNQNDAHSSTYYLDADAGVLIENINAAATRKSVLKLIGDSAIVYGGNGNGSLIFAQRQTETASFDVNNNFSLNYNLNVAGITTTLQLQVGTLGHTMVGITTILDEDNMASDSAAALATQQSIKKYVDDRNPQGPGGGNLAVSADSGSNESINLNTEVLDIEGTANEIETATGTNKVVIGLPNDVSITNLTLGGTVSAGSTTGVNGYYLKTTGIGVTWAAFPSSRTTSTQTATAGQTSFNFSYNVGFLDVFLNGVKLPTSEFTASNGSTIILDDAAFANDTLEFISFNTEANASAGAQNLTGLADVTITGTPVIGETLQHNGSQFVNDYTVTATTTSTSQTAILSLPVATYRSAEYTIQVTEGTKYHVTKVLAIHNGTNVYFNEYGTLFTNSSLSTFTLDVNSGNMRLLATPASTNSTVFKVKFTGIKV